jgi:hypothetical protein
MAKLEFTDAISEVTTEDSGNAKLGVLMDRSDFESDLFLRLQSWDESKRHHQFNEFIGRRVKVTIETID